MNFETEQQPNESEQSLYRAPIDLERYLSKKEIIERRFKVVSDWREGQYDKDIKENPKAESMRESLRVHNEIVTDDALELIEKQDLSPEEKTAACVEDAAHYYKEGVPVKGVF